MTDALQAVVILAKAVGVSSPQTVQNRFHQIDFIHNDPRLDTDDFTEAQAARRIEICSQLLYNPMDDRFRRRIVASDEKWLYLVNHEWERK